MIEISDALCVNCGSCVKACPNGVLSPGESMPELKPWKGCMECMHCAAACPTHAVSREGEPPCEYPAMPEDYLEKLIKTRRSIRHFKAEIPSREDLEWALAASNWAPTSKNQRANSFVVVWGAEKAGELRSHILDRMKNGSELEKKKARFFETGHDLLTGGAPCLILCLCRDDAASPHTDSAIALATLELLLQSRGIATCWAGNLTRYTDNDPWCRDFLNIPEGQTVCCALMVGLGDEDYVSIPERPPRPMTWIE